MLRPPRVVGSPTHLLLGLAELGRHRQRLPEQDPEEGFRVKPLQVHLLPGLPAPTCAGMGGRVMPLKHLPAARHRLDAVFALERERLGKAAPAFPGTSLVMPPAPSPDLLQQDITPGTPRPYEFQCCHLRITL